MFKLIVTEILMVDLLYFYLTSYLGQETAKESLQSSSHNDQLRKVKFIPERVCHDLIFLPLLSRLVAKILQRGYY